MIVTKEKTKLEVQTILIHLTSEEDKEDLVAIFHGAGKWFFEDNKRLAEKAAELETYVEDEIHGPLGTVLPAEGQSGG